MQVSHLGQDFQKQLMKEEGEQLKMAATHSFEVRAGLLWGQLAERVCKEALRQQGMK